MLYLLVGNPTAQSGRAADHLDRTAASVRARGSRVRLLATEPAGRTVGLVTSAIEELRPDVVLTFGGDGTFNEVARGILAAPGDPVPLGMLPMGTANNQGRSFGLGAGPKAIEKNLDVVFGGHVTQLDVGYLSLLDVDGRVTHESAFFDSVGWGMQADILAQRNRDRAAVKEIPLLRDVWRDQAVYAGATITKLLESYVQPTKFDARIVSEGETHLYTGMTDIVISNTALYAGEWIVDRNSEPDDGRFELAPFQGRRDWLSKTIRDLTVLDIKQEDLDVLGITHSVGYTAKDFDVELTRFGNETVAAQLDGEEWRPGRHYRVRCEPQALPLLTPRRFVPPWR